MRSMTLRAFVLLATTAVAACGGGYKDTATTGGGGTTTPPPTTTTTTPAALNLFSASNTMLATADTLSEGDTLTAIVTDSNSNTISGATVTFSITASTGAIIVTQATTDNTGTATAVLTTGGNPTLRTITVSATSGGVSDSLSVDVVDANSPPTTPASVAALNLFAGSAQLFADADTASEGVQLTAVVTNANGNVITGVPVSFTVDAGPAAIVVTRDTTDSTGTAVGVVTTAGVTTPRTVQVSASVTSGGTTFTDTVSLPVIGHATKILGTISDVRLTPAGSLTVNAIAQDADGNPVPNVPVTFVVSAGSIAPTTALITNASGATSNATITAGSVQPGGVITVTMTAPGATADSVNVTVVPSVSSIVLRSSSATMKADADTTAEGVTVTAVVADASGVLLDSEKVNFSLGTCATAGGTGALTPGSATTGADGTASTIVTTPGNATFPRTINVRAISVSDSSKCASVAISVVDPNTPTAAPSVAGIQVFAGANQLFADADTSAEGVPITAVALDSNGNTVSGVAVAFSITTSNNAVVQVTRATTDSTGTATALLTTGGDTTPRAVTVQAAVSSGGTTFTDTVTLNVIGHATTINGTLSSSQLAADNSAPIAVTASAVDAQQNPVANVPVTFIVSSGSITGGTACATPSTRCTVLTTDSTGQTTTSASLSTGGDSTLRSITITMTAAGATADSTTVQVVPVVATVDLTPATGSLFTDADTVSEGLTLSAFTRDANGAALANQPVTFTVSDSVNTRNGLLQQASAVTDSNGRATVVLTVGSALDTDVLTVTATYDKPTGTDPSDTAVINVVGRVAAVALITSSPQLESSADTVAEGVTITAIVRDGNNNLVTGVPVSFVADNGALQITRGTTDTTGTATAILTTGGDPTNQTITVTATAETSTTSINVAEVGTHVTVTGADGIGNGQSQTYTIKLLDAANAPLAQRTVALSATSGVTLGASSVQTGSDGTATVSALGATGGAATITASALGTTGSKSVTVSQYLLAYTGTIPSELKFSDAPINVTVQLTPATAGETIFFSSTRGTLGASSAVTDGAGQATVTLVSNGVGGAGETLITATGPASESVDKRISVSTTIEFVADTVASIDVMAEPATVSASTSTTTGTSTISAIVRDGSNNPVKNRQIDFTLSSTVGGTLSAATATTDSFGRATTVFTAGTQSSANGGITITATDSATATTDSVNITVGGVALFIALGTGNELSETTDTTSYDMPWAATVTDANGNAAPSDTQFRLKVISVEYQKGYYVACVDGAGNFVKWCPSYQVTVLTSPAKFGCLSEDANGNGILDPGENSGGTGNSNGKLDPGDVAVAPNTQPLTDGRTFFNVTYPKSYANWVEVKLQAIATVAGTETTSTVTFVLPPLADDVTDSKVSPPGTVGTSGNVESPYGYATTCSNPN